MLGTRWVNKGKQKEEAEKPFWISYADLMTALMMLFLIVMIVSLMSMINAQEGPEKERDDTINDVMKGIEQDMRQSHMDGSVDFKQRLIHFGNQAQFGNNSATVANGTAIYLNRIVPIILKRVEENERAQKWFKRVTVEGYTSQIGTYFHNLELSLKRSHNVLCSLLDPSISFEMPLTEEQKLQIRRIFMVGGFSANSTTGDPERDRRVEFRLEFWTVQEKKEGAAGQVPDQFDRMEVGKCVQQ